VERRQVAFFVEDRRNDRDVDEALGPPRVKRLPQPPLGLRDWPILPGYHAAQ
jgi:hypothetical protein